MPPVALLVVLVGLTVAVGIAVLSARQREAMEARYRQACRDHGLTPTDTPLGTSDSWLGQLDLLPRGDRDHSAVWGMEGPAELALGGQTVTVDCAAFEWWWEDRRTHHGGRGHSRTTWERRAVLAALVRLPAPYVMPRVRVEREGLLARFGIGGRGDLQVESEEFNKRYDVEVRDRHAAIRLFDADFQQQLLGRFEGTAFELAGDLALVVAATPGGGLTLATGARRGGAGGLVGMFTRSGDRIRTDPAIVAALPTMRHRALALLGAMPDGWWRGVAHADGSPDA